MTAALAAIHHEPCANALDLLVAIVLEIGAVGICRCPDIAPSWQHVRWLRELELADLVDRRELSVIPTPAGWARAAGWAKEAT